MSPETLPTRLLAGAVRIPQLLSIAVLVTATGLRAEPILIIAPQPNPAIPFETGDVAAGEHTGFSDVIEAQALATPGASVAGVVAGETGVQFRQSGGSGSFSSVTLRGSSAEHVNVYVDGVLLNEASGGGVNLSDIELMQAERIEIYRGSVPVQLGNSAIGGAINITTARAAGTSDLRLLAGGGAFGARRLSAHVALKPIGAMRQPVIVSFSHRQSTNDFQFLYDNGTEVNTDDDRRVKRHNALTRSTSGLLKTGQRLRSGARVEHVAQGYERLEELANWSNTGSAALGTRNWQLRSSLISPADDNNWASNYSGFVSLKKERLDDRDSTIGVGSQLVDTEGAVFGLRAFREKVQDQSSLSFSVRATAETSESVDWLAVGGPDNAQRLRSDLQAQYSRFLQGGERVLSAGVSGFIVSDDLQSDSQPAARFNTDAFLPYAGVRYALDDRWTAIANVSLQKRVPSFTELFGNQGIFSGNPNLQPETSRNLDVGLQMRSMAAAHYEQTIELAAYHSQQNDLIARVYNAQGIGRAENISHAVITGVEFSQTTVFTNGFEFDVNLTLQDAVNRSRISGFTGKQLPGQAAVDGHATVRYRTGQWVFHYDYQVNTDRFYDSANLLPAANQYIHNVGLGRRWRNWQLDVQLDNLSNAIYEDFNGYPKPGRAGFFSITYQPQSRENNDN